MEATRNYSTISSLQSRQLALLEAECKRVMENPSKCLGFQKRIGHPQGFRRHPMLFYGSTPIYEMRQRFLISVESASGTPTAVDPTTRRNTPRYRPRVGAEGNPSRPSSEVFRLIVPSTSYIEILQPVPQLPNAAPILEASLCEVADPDSDVSEEQPRLSPFQESLGPAFANLGWNSSDPSYVTISPCHPSPQKAPMKPTPSQKSPTPFAGPSLFDCVDLQLNQLDGTTCMQHKIWEELCLLNSPEGISDCIQTIVECLVDHGMTRGYPSNIHIADFCAYILERTSSCWKGSGDCNVLDSFEVEIRAAFLSTFKHSWTPLPKTGSLASRLLLRIASFYGHLYTTGVLYEEDYKACINFLATLSPLPREGLRALLSGDIEGHLELPVCI